MIVSSVEGQHRDLEFELVIGINLRKFSHITLAVAVSTGCAFSRVYPLV